jgi:RNA polymerase sigma-70 factor (ECF subfamily)
MIEGSEADDTPPLSERIVTSLPELTRFVRRNMSKGMLARESASDIVQSTFRSLLQSGSEFQDRGEASFQAWLRTAARNKLRTRTRHWSTKRRGITPKALDVSPDEMQEVEPLAPQSADPLLEAQLLEEAERLRRAFAALPDEERTLLVRSQIDGASHVEIARETGLSPTTVRRAVARAMALLAADLEQ